MIQKRSAKIRRKTKETDIEVLLNLDGSGRTAVKTGIGFLDHMLILFAYHGLFDLTVRVRRQDLQVDMHHTNEDAGICLGEAVRQALRDKQGIARYGFSAVPMDETLVRVTLDISGRPSLHDSVAGCATTALAKSKDKNFYSYNIAKQFLRAFCDTAGVNMHLEIICGDDLHHVIEAMFKAFGRALSQATRLDPRRKGVPSSKGKL